LSDAATIGFERLFGRPPAVAREAPGRVNLIGEHTDYNDGFVMPIATPQRTRVELAPSDRDVARVWSASVAAGHPVEYRIGDERRRGEWIDYVQGVTVAMRARGLPIRGFDARIESDLPLGAGLSSSASLEIAFVRALADAFALVIDPIEAAQIGHDAETGLVGAPVGIMDQMAASLAAPDAALFLDTRSLAFEQLSLPADAELAVIDSGITHRHASGEYRVRRDECVESARRLGVRALRDVTSGQLTGAPLPPPLDARARHVVTENARVLSARDALHRGDAKAFGELMNESHRSMRDDFQVSTTDVDALVEIAQQQPEVFGARMTGGGFGGSVVLLVVRGAARTIAELVATRYRAERGRSPTLLIPRHCTLG
jgi:galactokinase